jgi:hypothetical protein
VRRADSKPVYANGRISFEIDLAPGQTWHACLLYDVFDGERRIGRRHPASSAR